MFYLLFKVKDNVYAKREKWHVRKDKMVVKIRLKKKMAWSEFEKQVSWNEIKTLTKVLQLKREIKPEAVLNVHDHIL